MLNEAGLILAKETAALMSLLLDQNDSGRITLGEWMREKVAAAELSILTQCADTAYIRELFLLDNQNKTERLFDPDGVE